MNPDDEPCGAVTCPPHTHPAYHCTCDREPGHADPHRCTCQYSWHEKPKAA